MSKTRDVHIPSADGDIPAVLTLPESGSGPGLVLIQEIFGVNPYVRSVADRLADEGYVVITPHMFWRIEPDFVIDAKGPDDLPPAMAVASQYLPEHGVNDTGAALAHAAGLSVVTGPVGIIGFCFGGSWSYMAASHHDPACAVAYYGSMIGGNLDLASQITCPILFHFSGEDPFIAASDVAALRNTTSDMSNAEVLVQAGAGHAFDNNHNPMFSKPEAAAAAWSRTSEFLAKHLKG